MGITAVIALGLNKVIVPFLRGTGNVEIMNQAYFAAEGGIEDALYDISGHKAGYTNNEDRDTFSDKNFTDFKWKIANQLPVYQADLIGDIFRIPPPRSGDSPNDCEWNVIQKDESILVPLFMDKSPPGDKTEDVNIKNPADADLAITKIVVKLRTPAGKKLKIDEADEETSISDDTTMSWTFFGNNKVTPSVPFSLREITSYDTAIPPNRKTDESTEIYESKINNLMDDTSYTVIDTEAALLGTIDDSSAIFSGVDQDGATTNILDFITHANIHEPSLKLSIISNLLDENDKLLPFLEYQVYITAKNPTPNIKTKIVSTGYAEDFQQKLETAITTQAAESFVEFVIFQ